MRVRVEFGRREVVGIVLGEAPSLEGAGGRLKRVLEVLDPAPIFTPGHLELTKRIAATYFVPWYRALEASLPVGLKLRLGRAPRRRTVPLLLLAMPFEAARARIEGDKRTKGAHRTALEIVREFPEALTAIEVARRVGSGVGLVQGLIKKGLLRVALHARASLESDYPVPPPPRELTPEQSGAITRIRGVGRGTFLLEGVTGSGKTEVYLRLIEAALAEGKGAIVLVPEIALTPQTLARFRARLGDAVAVLHSALSPSERYESWTALLFGRARVALGPRSAIFAPVGNLGIVILDEAHEGAYKQGEAPRYDARTVARWRAEAAACPLVLGTATPTLEMIDAGAERLYLPRRVAGTPPAVEVVDLRREILAGNLSIFSRRLVDAVRDALRRGRQSVLFLNRLGHSTFIFCRACGMAMRCEECDLALVYHKRHGNLRCHGCQTRRPVPPACPACGDKRLRPLGAGTERVEAEARKVFPRARILRLDSETTARRGSHLEVLSAFARGEADLLIGTQMVGKGHDLPGVEVVGIILAETSLHLPDFRARERTFALLRQAIGRAGRAATREGDPPPCAILQTYDPAEPAIHRAASGDGDGFLVEERTRREAAGLPPFRRLVVLHVSAPTEQGAERAAQVSCERLRSALRRTRVPFEILGPATAPLERLRSRWRHQARILLPRDVDPATLPLSAAFDPKARSGATERGVEIRLDVDALDLL